MQDIVIVGGGPVGLYALYYAGQREMSATLFDALDQLGGQLMALYPDVEVNNVAGVPSILARELVDNLRLQALSDEPEVRLGQRVSAVGLVDGGFEVKTASSSVTARTVLLAPGPGALFAPALFECDGPQQRSRGLFIEPESALELADRRVLICGGKQEAIGWALDAAGVARAVTVINWTDIHAADGARVDPVFNRNVDVMTPWELLEIHGEERVEAATIIHSETRATERLAVDAVLLARGQLTDLRAISSWAGGLELLHNGVRVDRQMASSAPGLFVAGDLASYPGKLKTISAGAGEAAIAVNHAKAFIDPEAKPQPGFTAG